MTIEPRRQQYIEQDTPSRFPIGVEALDSQLRGGLPRDSIAVGEIDPSTQAELLLPLLLSSQQPGDSGSGSGSDSPPSILYISTIKSADTLRAEWEKCPYEIADDKERIEIVYVSATGGQSRLECIKTTLQESDHELTIVDTISDLEMAEVARRSLQSLLNEVVLRDHIHGQTVFLARDKTCSGAHAHVTDAIADIKLSIESKRSGDDTSHFLSLDKARGGRPARFKLTLDSDIGIDSSREIA